MDKKNQQSKSQFGTLTAKQDANNDYSSSTSSATTSSSTGAGTLTAKYDANNDYGKGGSQSGQTGQQKVKTSDKNTKS